MRPHLCGKRRERRGHERIGLLVHADEPRLECAGEVVIVRGIIELATLPRRVAGERRAVGSVSCGSSRLNIGQLEKCGGAKLSRESGGKRIDLGDSQRLGNGQSRVVGIGRVNGGLVKVIGVIEGGQAPARNANPRAIPVGPVTGTVSADVTASPRNLPAAKLLAT